MQCVRVVRRLELSKRHDTIDRAQFCSVLVGHISSAFASSLSAVLTDSRAQRVYHYWEYMSSLSFQFSVFGQRLESCLWGDLKMFGPRCSSFGSLFPIVFLSFSQFVSFSFCISLCLSVWLSPARFLSNSIQFTKLFLGTEYILNYSQSNQTILMICLRIHLQIMLIQ